jgi:hypothetical protein
LSYAGAGLVVTLVLALIVGLVLGGEATGAVWLAAGIAWVLQLFAFAGLLLVRSTPSLFIAGWAVGMVLRFGALAAAAFWVTRTAAYPPAPLLLSLVGFMFVLLMLEPVFLRRGLRAA